MSPSFKTGREREAGREGVGKEGRSRRERGREEEKEEERTAKVSRAE